MDATTRDFINWVDQSYETYRLNDQQIKQLVVEFVAAGRGTIDWGRKYLKVYGG